MLRSAVSPMLVRDDTVADRERRDRHAEVRRRHLEQHAPRFGGDAAHRIAVGLQRIRSARAALIDGDVGAAHHAGRVLERDVELVRHDLAERGAGALAEIGLADEERRGVVGTNDDPRVELQVIEIGIRSGGARPRCRNASTPSTEIAATDATSSPDVWRNVRLRQRAASADRLAFMPSSARPASRPH